MSKLSNEEIEKSVFGKITLGKKVFMSHLPPFPPLLSTAQDGMCQMLVNSVHLVLRNN